MPESAQPTARDYRVYRLEAQLVTNIRLRLQSLGAVVVKIHGESHQQRVVDILACYKGRFVAIEAKVGDNQPTAHQSNFLQSVRNAGGLATVAWTVADALIPFQQIDSESGNTL